MAKPKTIYRVEELEQVATSFKALRDMARDERKKERLAFYEKVSALLKKRVVFGKGYGDLGDGKGFPMIAKVDVNKPGEIRVSLYLDKSGSGMEIQRTQNQICKERSLWFKVAKEDKSSDNRHLILEKSGEKTWKVKASNHFQTIVIKTKIVPNQTELDRLFDRDPVKILG